MRSTIRLKTPSVTASSLTTVRLDGGQPDPLLDLATAPPQGLWIIGDDQRLAEPMAPVRECRDLGAGPAIHLDRDDPGLRGDRGDRVFVVDERASSVDPEQHDGARAQRSRPRLTEGSSHRALHSLVD